MEYKLISDEEAQPFFDCNDHISSDQRSGNENKQLVTVCSQCSQSQQPFHSNYNQSRPRETNIVEKPHRSASVQLSRSENAAAVHGNGQLLIGAQNPNHVSLEFGVGMLRGEMHHVFHRIERLESFQRTQIDVWNQRAQAEFDEREQERLFQLERNKRIWSHLFPQRCSIL